MTRRRVKPNPAFEFGVKGKANPELKALHYQLQEITLIVRKWINRNYKKDIPVVHKFDYVSNVRLLKLKVWEIQYRVDVGEILDMLVPILRSQAISKKAHGGLGISIPSLVGPAAERILQKEIRKRYPDNSHVFYRREQQRERDIAREIAIKEAANGAKDHLPQKDRGMSLLNYSSVQEFQRIYDERVERERKRFNNLYDQKWRIRKHYRSNPWI